MGEPTAEESGEGTIEFEASFAFPNGSRLAVLLIVNTSSDFPVWRHYSFHYMTGELECIFRYDNARHYPRLPTFPHHTHEGPDERVIACRQPSIRRIRDEIEAYLRS